MRCHVIVDNRCEFEHSSSHVDCNFDARLVSKSRKYCSTKKLRKHVCQLILVTTKPSVQSWLTASRPIQSVEAITIGSCAITAWSWYHSICSLCHRAFMGSLKISRQTQPWRLSVHKISRCILPSLCFLPLLS